MVEKDIILAKTATIQRCLQRIKESTQLVPSSLEDFDIQDIFVLNLQRAVQAAIDIATHVIVSEGWELPDTLKKHFAILEQKKVLDHQLSEQLQKMIGFRNIAVHDYQSINIEVLKNILLKNLTDLETFYHKIIDRYELN